MIPPPAALPPFALPPLARTALDRAAHRRLDPGWLAVAWPTARVLLVDTSAGGTAMVRDGPDGPVLVLIEAAEAPPGDPADRLFVGMGRDGTALFAMDVPLVPAPGTRVANLRDVGGALDDHDAGLLTAAVALANWHASHRYSPATGQLTTVVEGGWARRDPDGGQFWPRTDPAIIVLVHDGAGGPGGRCLLGHAVAWHMPGRRRFSCLAGFVEAGESAEATVVREVREEVGVEVGRIAYVSSQAWPFPSSLMLGFTAVAEPGAPVRADGKEIAEARWFSRREIAAAFAGERVEVGGGDVLMLPSGASIAAYLVARWLREE